MGKRKRVINKKIGQPPGEVFYTGEYSEETSKLIYRYYSPDTYNEEIITDIKKLKLEDDQLLNWVELSGFNDIELIKNLGDKFGIHQMHLEDIVNTNHLPKFEEGENYITIMLKSFIIQADSEDLKRNNICIILKDKMVLDIHEFSHDIIDAKVERIKMGKGKTRRKGADYLFYVLLDAYVDTYFLVFDDLREKIVNLEDFILTNPRENKIEEIHTVKKELTELRKFLFPLREAIGQVVREEPELIEEENIIYFRDLLDHLNQLSEYHYTYNDMIKSLVDLNTSNINNNINQVMKVLTIIATIFIPLTFIAGVYGMNFEYMPELGFKYGYHVTIGIMVLVGVVMLLFMKRKKWF